MVLEQNADSSSLLYTINAIMYLACNNNNKAMWISDVRTSTMLLFGFLIVDTSTTLI